jgi:hypothetical protein
MKGSLLEPLEVGFLSAWDVPFDKFFFTKADWGLAEKKGLHVFFSSPVLKKGSLSRHLAAFSERT